MRLKNFLLEDKGGRAKAIDEKKFRDMISKYFTDSFRAFHSESARFYRGTNTSAAPMMFTNPNEYIRQSIQNQNYYTLIMSYDPSWSAFPPRDKCVIATTSIATADHYGKPYVVLPANKSTIGVCPKGDVWSSFNGTLGASHNLMPLLDMLENLFIEVNMGDTAGENINAFKKACKMAEKKISSMAEDDKHTWYGLTGYNKYDPKKGLYKWVTEMFNPKDNHFKTIKAGEVFPERNMDREVWTDGECLLCTYEVMENLRESFS